MLPILMTGTPVVGAKATPLAKKVIVPVGAEGPLATKDAVNVAGVVLATLLPPQATTELAAVSKVRVTGLCTKLPFRVKLTGLDAPSN